MKYLDGIKVLVFDFDGTLVQTNELKYNAYFKIFPTDQYHHKIITKVLEQRYEESRYTIIEAILQKLNYEGDMQERIKRIAQRYSDLVLSGAKQCSECKNAEKLLMTLYKKYPIYLSSTTPEEPLLEIVNFRGWREYFKKIFGYPKKKSETLVKIIKNEKVHPLEILVIGDGYSDNTSASQTGTNFYKITSESNLIDILS